MNCPKIEPLEARIAPATISIASASVTEGDAGTTSLLFTITLSEDATEEITVNFSTTDGTAVSSGSFADFESQSGTVITFGVGERTKDVTVLVNGDVFDEANQTLTATLSNPSGTNTIDTATATGTIIDDDSAALFTITNLGDVTEGAGVTSNFTVTLSHAIEANATITFTTGATSDTAKPAPGVFSDYLAQTGTLTFTPGGSLTQNIAVTITDDTFLEAIEQFTVTLSAPTGGSLGSPATAIGKILNDAADTTVGLTIGDVQKVEGNTDSTVVVRPTLSGPLGSNLSLTLTTQSGTAIAGSDFSGGTPTPVVITAGQTSAAFTITIEGDTVFEGTESFFVNLTGAPAEITVVNNNPISPTAQATARVYIFNDDIQALASNKLRWTDVDGDIVTLSVSKGSFFDANGNLLTGLISLVDSGTVGGKQLQLLDLVGNSGVSFGSRFAGANVSITAVPEAGYPLASNGRVDVGLIQAAVFISQELQVIGVDLGVVTVDGDLARITAGDQFSTTAIRTLDVYSLGVKPGSLAPDSTATSTTLRTQSDVLGPIGTVKVKTNVEGFLHVLGAEFGTIGVLKIDGDLKGGAPDNSGRVTASGRINSATIGNIIGGTGSATGVLSGTAETGGKLGTVTVLGDVIGGTGASSGEIFSTSTIGAIKVGGKLAGGDGEDSGSIQSGGSVTSLSVGTIVGGMGKGSGAVRVGVNNSGNATALTGNLGAVKITGMDASDDSIKGGPGVNSGRIDVVGSIASLTVAGDIQGGTGSGSGAVVGKTTMGAIKVAGNITGNTGENSGSIQSAGKITSLSVGYIVGDAGKGSGAVRAGVDNSGTIVNGTGAIGTVTFDKNTANDSLKGGAGVNSGRLDVAANIASFLVKGDVEGGTGNGSGGIVARGNIDKLVIEGDLNGGDSTATAFLDKSGFISALRLKSVTINGDIESGTNGGAGIASSGAIRADVIDALTVRGDLIGNLDTATSRFSPVVISAAGTTNSLAIKSLKIGGDAKFAEILAGYNDVSTASNFRGTARSGDASIGAVAIDGNISGVNIVAGGAAGADGRFGTADDSVVAPSATALNNPLLISKIGSVIIGDAAEVNTQVFGIVAQQLGTIKIAGSTVPLQAGPSNDLGAGVEIVTGTNFRARELPAV